MKGYTIKRAPGTKNTVDSLQKPLCQIKADYRENPSGIPHMLNEKGAEVITMTLKTGDYIINDEIIIERKSAEDFVQSLISDRLFKQCAGLTKASYRPLMMLEGNPYKTPHKIHHNAIKGALLSIIACWQIPVIYSKNTEYSAELLLMLHDQASKQVDLLKYHSYKPRRLKNHRLKFLQGLPKTGAVMANRLFEHFGSIEAVINADETELQEVEGIGKKLAGKIRKFVSGK